MTAAPPKLRRTALHRCVDALSLAALLAASLWLTLNWGGLPERLPAHYNFAGEIDGWGGKGSLIALLAVCWLFFGGLSLLERLPGTWNTGVKVTEDNRQQVYQLLLDMLCLVKGAALAIFLAIGVCSALLRPLPPWFLPLALLATFAPIFWYLWRVWRLGRTQ